MLETLIIRNTSLMWEGSFLLKKFPLFYTSSVVNGDPGCSPERVSDAVLNGHVGSESRSVLDVRCFPGIKVLDFIMNHLFCLDGSTWKGCQFRRHRDGLCWWRQGRWSDPPWRPCWRPLPAWPCPLGPSTGSAPETRPPSGASLPHSATGGYLSTAVWCSLECPQQWSPRKPVVSQKMFKS